MIRGKKETVKWLLRNGWWCAALAIASAAAAVQYQTWTEAKHGQALVLESRSLAQVSDQQWVDAERSARESLRKEPTSGRAWFLLGLSLHYQKRFPEARSAFESSIKFGHESYLGYYNIACGHALLGNEQEALHNLTTAVEEGFCDVDWMQEDPDLASIRSNEQFGALVNSLTGTRNPDAMK